MAASKGPTRTPPAAATLPAVIVLGLLTACTPFRAERPNGGSAADPGRQILSAAEAQLGAPYRYGGNGPDAFDCSGLVAYAYRTAGLTVPRTAAQQFAAATPVAQDELQPGDLVFFRIAGREVNHVGIYAGEQRFVHAPQSGGLVRFASLENDWYRQRYVGAGRLVPASP